MTKKLKRPQRALRQKAEKCWLYWLMGFQKDCPFITREEAEEAWQTVKRDWYEVYTIGAIDEHGQINYLPEAWWMFDCPGAPFKPAPVEGLPALQTLHYRQHEALINWGIIPVGTPDPLLRFRAQDIKVLYDRKMTGNDNYLPFVLPTTKEDMEKTWQEHLAEYNAWVRLGYIGDNDGTDTRSGDDQESH